MSEETNIPNNAEIDKALKEFEAAKSQAGQTPPVSTVPQKQVEGIKFETDNWKQSVPSPEDNIPKMVQLVIKWSGGVIKDQRQAEYVLLGFSVLIFSVSIFLFFQGTRTAIPPIDPNSFDQLQFTQ